MIIFNKKSILFLVFVFFAVSGSAKELLPLLNGMITDVDTGETLPFAKIQIKETNRVVTANQNGLFTLLDVPINSILVINKTGYEGSEVKIYPESQKLSIGLLKFNPTESVVVSYKAKTPQKIQDTGISQYSLSPELTNSIPNLGEQDIFRSIQLLPGVSGSNESSSGLIVRGGSIDQNLVLFDDFTVYMLITFLDSSVLLITML